MYSKYGPKKGRRKEPECTLKHIIVIFLLFHLPLLVYTWNHYKRERAQDWIPEYDGLEDQPATNRSRESFVTLLYGNDFVNATKVMWYSLLKMNTSRGMLVLVMDMIDPLTPENRQSLLKMGCRIKDVRIIDNPWSINPVRGSLNYQFTKLRIWQQTEYDKLVYLDSDMIVLKNVDNLFSFEQLSAAEEYGSLGIGYSVFNAGLMVIKPNSTLFKDMVANFKKVSPGFSMEQHFLNIYFERWWRLPYVYNTPANFYITKPTLWEKRAIRIVHYTGTKPWEEHLSSYNINLKPVYKLWWAFNIEMQHIFK